MYSDEDGTFGILVALVMGALIGVTTRDIYEIVSGHVDSSVNGDELEITDSYKVKTPWVQFGYIFYLKYIKSKTKWHIKGSVLGAQFEWFSHNVAYAKSKITGNVDDEKKAKTVNIGGTIFSDSHENQNWKMKMAYFIIFIPIRLIDFWINDGDFGKW